MYMQAKIDSKSKVAECHISSMLINLN